MSSTTQMIQAAEARWMQKLFRHNKSYFEHAGLPSHNHWHHLRVWYFIRELVEALHQRNIFYSKDELEGLIIAAFFHDIAMHRTFDEVHGKWGAELCRSYFSKANPSPPDCLPEVLQAIELHDDKNYLHPLKVGKKPGVAVLLSAGDDLDAFGATGILRYGEILMLRGFDLDDIPKKVLTNALSRWEHFRNTFAQNREVIHTHQKRYQRLVDFFQSILENGQQAADHRAILKHIRENLNKQEKTHTLTGLLEPANTPTLVNFRDTIENEMQEVGTKKFT